MSPRDHDELDEELDEELDDTFPASDPPSVIQPHPDHEDGPPKRKEPH